MTPTTSSAQKRGIERSTTKYSWKNDNDQIKNRSLVLKNLKIALIRESYGTDEFVKILSLEVTTCFTTLTMKVCLVSRIIDSKPRPDFRKTQSTTSLAEKKVRGKKKKSDTAFTDLGSIPHQIDVMVNFFLYELDNGMTGVLGLLTRKQISEQFKDYNMSNKWLNFESLLRNVHDKSGVGSLYGRNAHGFIPPWVVQDHSQDKGVNKPPGNISNETGSDGNKGTNTNPRNQGTNNKRGSPDIGNSLKKRPRNLNNLELSGRGGNNGTKERKKEVRHWGKHNMKLLVILENDPLRNQGPPKFLDIVGQKISVVLKEPDPEILYRLYKINEQVRYAGGGQVPV
eukprot:jgi/Psemu1/43741/gm1.43741_g